MLNNAYIKANHIKINERINLFKSKNKLLPNILKCILVGGLNAPHANNITLVGPIFLDLFCSIIFISYNSHKREFITFTRSGKNDSKNC